MTASQQFHNANDPLAWPSVEQQLSDYSEGHVISAPAGSVIANLQHIEGPTMSGLFSDEARSCLVIRGGVSTPAHGTFLSTRFWERVRTK
jgi:hypothetical protein